MAAALLNFDPTRRREKTEERRSGRVAFATPPGSAQILFFTGVRIERHGEPLACTPTTAEDGN